MKFSFKKSGQKLVKRLSRSSMRATEDATEHIQENVIDRISHIKNVRLFILEWSLLVVAVTFLALTQSYWYTESYATESYTDSGTYTEATIGTVKTMNPLFATSSSEETLSRLMFAALATPDYSGHMGLDLAKSISTKDSGKTWTVTLRDDLKWSDGEPITLDDVMFTVDLIKNPNLNTSYRNTLSNVTVTQEKDSISFALRAPNAYFKSSLDFPILPKHVLGEVDATRILENTYSSKPTVTSGAFIFNASQTIGTEGEQIIYLNPNKHYRKGSSLVASFAVHAYPTEDKVISALNAGTITGTAEVSGINKDKVTNSIMHIRESAMNYGTYAFFNLESQTMRSREVRKAIQKGIKMEDLRAASGDEPALDYPILSSQLDNITWPKMPEYNEKAAIEEINAWKAANPEAAKTPISIATVNTGYLGQIAQNLGEQLKHLGIENIVTVYEPNQDFTINILSNRTYDILIYQVGLGTDPDLFAYYHSSQAVSSGLNLSNYRDATSNDLILAARTTTDEQLRNKKYENFLNRWVDAVPAIGITQTNLVYFVNNNVRAFSTENSFVSKTDRFNDVNLWSVTKTTKNRTP